MQILILGLKWFAMGLLLWVTGYALVEYTSWIVGGIAIAFGGWMVVLWGSLYCLIGLLISLKEDQEK